ncbi:MAG TPA: nuclease domain-containing protein, partial [Anaerolineales bacterium]|nr:nuclease domain-containing protein [Anaerolineales bacterium]
KRQLSGDAFENLAKITEENWENIKNNPAKEIKLGTKIVDLTNLQSAQSIRSMNQSVQKPHQRRQLIVERQETYDSEENRFLVHVLKDILIPKAKPLMNYFRLQAAKIKEIQRKPDGYRHGQNYLHLWQERRVNIEQEANRLESQAANIEGIINKAEGYLQEPFLRNITSNVSSFRPSAKIADSKVYGPIYRAYQDYLSNAKSSRQKSLAWALEEKSVRRVSKLYEIWVFFEVYARLVHDFGFLPDGDSPFDTIEVYDEDINLREGSEYRLSFVPKKNYFSKVPVCTAVLSYSPKIKPRPCKLGKKCFDQNICPSLPCYNEINTGTWEELKPDITLTLQTGAQIKKIALDVKYRNYADMKYVSEKDKKYMVNTPFEADIFGTAKMKYLNGLECDASFVLHSDPNPQYTVFGGEPFTPTPLRERANGEWWPGHKIGAVCVTPSHQKGLDSLLRCFLMYHARLVSICWNPLCHSILTEGNGMMKQPGYKGDYYQCPDCGEFWISQYCSNKTQHHPLVKMGKASFHKTASQNEWNCVCPACGDQFTADSKIPVKQ